MAKHLLIGSLIITIALSGLTNARDSEKLPTLALIPFPAEVAQSPGAYSLNINSRLIVSSSPKDQAQIFKADLFDRFEIDLKFDHRIDVNGWTLIIQNHSTLPDKLPYPPRGKEAYAISVTPERVMLVASGPSGFYWGTRTLLQLIQQKGESFVFPAVEIKDRPRFERRILLLDPARNFISVPKLKQLIDLMADYKYNVLHLHLTDDQGWRFGSEAYPKLGEVGGKGVYYTKSELRGLVDYALKRGVEAMPEIDMPGHATAMIAAYPELSCSGEPVEVSKRFGILPYALCPAKEEVYEFIDNLMGEAVDVFSSRYVHTGSDEVLAYDWESSPECKKLMAEKDLHGKEGLHAYFLERVNKIVKGHGKTMMVWDEALDIAPEGTVVQVWQNSKYTPVSVRRGFKTLTSPIGTTYVNYSRFILPMKKCYRFEPLPPGLNDTEKKLILGGGACLWGNYLKSEGDIDRRLFPRVLAISEVFWSPPNAPNYSDFRARLALEKPKLESRGVEFGNVDITAVRDTFKIGGQLAKSGSYMVIDYINVGIR